jgi:hypothetical protein
MADLNQRNNQRRRRRRRDQLNDDDDDDDDDDDYMPNHHHHHHPNNGGGVHYIEDDPDEVFPSADDNDDSDYRDTSRPQYRGTSEESDISTSEDDDKDSDYENENVKRSRRAAARNSKKRKRGGTGGKRSRSFRSRGRGRRLNDDDDDENEEEEVDPNVRRSHRSLGTKKKSYREIESDDGEAYEQEEEWENTKDISGRSVPEMNDPDKLKHGHLISREWLLSDRPSPKQTPLLYVPQVGDDIVYCPMLHQQYLNDHPSPYEQPWDDKRWDPVRGRKPPLLDYY